MAVGEQQLPETAKPLIDPCYGKFQNHHTPLPVCYAKTIRSVQKVSAAAGSKAVDSGRILSNSPGIEYLCSIFTRALCREFAHKENRFDIHGFL